jgi:glycogen phosphorylase
MWHDLWSHTAVDDVPIGHITNGVHLPTWVGPHIARLLVDRVGPDWQDDADQLRWHRTAHIPPDELWQARAAQRSSMVEHVRLWLVKEADRRGEDAAWAARALDPR